MLIRFFDIIFSLLALICLLPLFLPIFLVLRFSGEGYIFYCQSRVGKGGKAFSLIKFATMLKNSPSIGAGEITLKNDPRVLPLGEFLRKTKINELPQIFNILRGEISIVGPRPLTPRNFAIYNQEVQETIAKVRPGLSGIGSIVFRDEESIIHSSSKSPEKCYQEDITPYKGELEKWFSLNQSLNLYFSLTLLTAWVVFFPKSGIVWKIFPSLPTPPDKLKRQLKFPVD